MEKGNITPKNPDRKYRYPRHYDISFIPRDLWDEIRQLNLPYYMETTGAQREVETAAREGRRVGRTRAQWEARFHAGIAGIEYLLKKERMDPRSLTDHEKDLLTRYHEAVNLEVIRSKLRTFEIWCSFQTKCRIVPSQENCLINRQSSRREIAAYVREHKKEIRKWLLAQADTDTQKSPTKPITKAEMWEQFKQRSLKRNQNGFARDTVFPKRPTPPATTTKLRDPHWLKELLEFETDNE